MARALPATRREFWSTFCRVVASLAWLALLPSAWSCRAEQPPPGPASGHAEPQPPLPGVAPGAVAPATITATISGSAFYVSSSTGKDSNAGTIAAPFATVARGIEAMAAGDTLLLRRGDTFYESIETWKNGLSFEQPTIIGAYGDAASSPRPVVDPKGKTGFKGTGGGKRPETLEHLVLRGLHFRQSTNIVGSSAWRGSPSGAAGIFVLRPGRDFRIEDVMVEAFSTNIVLKDDTRMSGLHDVVIRRSVIVDAYSNDDSHSQGIYMAYVHNALIEDSIVDHNGYNDQVPGAHATKFNHNIYIQSNCTKPVLRNSIVARGSSHGFQLRPSGVAEGNVLLANPIAGFVAMDNLVAGSKVVIKDNVVLHGSRRSIGEPEKPGILGWGLEVISHEKDKRPPGFRVEVIGNIVAHGEPGARHALRVSKLVDGVVERNVVFDWGEPEGSTPNFFASERTVASYSRDRFGQSSGSIEAFLAGARQVREGAWDPGYTAQSVRKYFQEAFQEAK